MESIKDDAEIVSRDFIASLEKIDFSKPYDPFSREFQTSLNIGLMALVLLQFGSVTKDAVEVQDMKDDISDRIMGAKKGIQKYIETGDMSYRQIAETELSNASALIKKAYSRLPTGDEKARLKTYESEVEELKRQLIS